jgi:hypothetical protein
LNTNFVITNIFVYNDKHKIAILTSNDSTLFIPLNFLKYNVNRDSKYHEVEEDVKNIYNFIKDDKIMTIFKEFGYDEFKK